MMIEVRIRHETEEESHALTEVHLENLNEIIPILRRWEVSYDGEDSNDLFGRFVIPDTGPAYFEVVVNDLEE